MPLQFVFRGLSLISFSLAQLFYPLARTLILARILSSFEFGFASALAASYATFELITDIAIHRFVLASPRSEYQETLAGRLRAKLNKPGRYRPNTSCAPLQLRCRNQASVGSGLRLSISVLICAAAIDAASTSVPKRR
jgi:hypothetical protein